MALIEKQYTFKTYNSFIMYHHRPEKKTFKKIENILIRKDQKVCYAIEGFFKKRCTFYSVCTIINMLFLIFG